MFELFNTVRRLIWLLLDRYDVYVPIDVAVAAGLTAAAAVAESCVRRLHR